MPAWTAFVGLTLVVLVALLVLARASQEYVPDDTDESGGTGPGADADADAGDRTAASSPSPSPSPDRDGTVPGRADGDRTAVGPVREDADGDFDAGGDECGSGDERPSARRAVDPGTGGGEDRGAVVELERPRGRGRPPARETVSAADVPTGVLLANVTISQATFAVVLLAGAWLARIPASAFGLDPAPDAVAGAAGVGAVLGVVLYVLNAAGSSLASAGGVEYDETLRDLLTPSSARGWVALLGVTLPVIAGFEEFLFRAALIGVPAAGLGLPVWPLAVASSAVFAFGHGAQGRAGIVVTGLLGFGLAAAFVLSGSLVVVVVAHYVVNALEFVVGGHFGVDLFED